MADNVKTPLKFDGLKMTIFL